MARSQAKSDKILREAERLFSTNQSVSVRNIADKAGVAIGLVTHHFGSYAGLLAALDRRLNKRLGKGLPTATQLRAGGDRQESVVLFLCELARLDLADENRRLRKAAARASWDWGPENESKVQTSYSELFDPLANGLELDAYIVKALWAIYQEALRLRFNNIIQPPGGVATSIGGEVEAIQAYIRPQIARLLRSGQVPSIRSSEGLI